MNKFCIRKETDGYLELYIDDPDCEGSLKSVYLTDDEFKYIHDIQIKFLELQFFLKDKLDQKEKCDG